MNFIVYLKFCYKKLIILLVEIIGKIESSSLKKDNFLLSDTGHIPFSNYPIHSNFSENNKTV